MERLLLALVMLTTPHLVNAAENFEIKIGVEKSFDARLIDAAKENPDYYTLKDNFKVSLKEVDIANVDVSSLIVNKVTKLDNLQSTKAVDITAIVNIMSKFWQIFSENKPAAKAETSYAVALPKGVLKPSELSGWSKPKGYEITFTFENAYGIDVITAKYKVIYIYGGSYNGKGKYLAGVWAIPVMIDVLWGFSFSMNAYVPDSTIVNVGTDKDPIAALQLKVSWSASSYVKDIKGTNVYYIQGDGYFDEIASPFRIIQNKLHEIDINEKIFN